MWEELIHIQWMTLTIWEKKCHHECAAFKNHILNFFLLIRHIRTFGFLSIMRDVRYVLHSGSYDTYSQCMIHELRKRTSLIVSLELAGGQTLDHKVGGAKATIKYPFLQVTFLFWPNEMIIDQALHKALSTQQLASHLNNH